jgi:AraC-like DNA-binding protein
MLPSSTPMQATAAPHSGRLMWITPDRVFYVGLLGAPSERTMGALIAYVATTGQVRVSIAGGDWQVGDMAIVPPHVPHRVISDSRLIHVVKLEAETIDLARLPGFLQNAGVVDAPDFVALVRQRHRQLCAMGAALDLSKLDFDEFFFGQALLSRTIDRRIAAVIEAIKANPSAATSAESCAESAFLSFSRFLHLFKQEVGVPFRSFRTWKRARSLLHYVSRESNLAHVALDAGYPDSTHFSHSIRQVYGLKPRDIFAGSRRLAVFTTAPLTAAQELALR